MAKISDIKKILKEALNEMKGGDNLALAIAFRYTVNDKEVEQASAAGDAIILASLIDRLRRDVIEPNLPRGEF